MKISTNIPLYLLQLVGILPFVLFILFWDLMVGFSLFENNDYLTFSAVSIVITIIPFCFFRKNVFLLGPAIYFLILLLLPFSNIVPTKPLARAMYKFNEGMRVEEIIQIVDIEFSKTNFRQPTLRIIDEKTHQFILDPTNVNYDWHWLLVYYENKKFSSAKISPD
jgi:hypothetical protein